MATEWYYAKDNEKSGPISEAELRQRASSGQLAPTDLVWTHGMLQWANASTVHGLFAAVSGPPPLPFRAPTLASTEAGASKPEVIHKDIELDEKLNMNISELDFSVRATNCLESEGIETVLDLVACTEGKLLKIRNFSESTLEHVRKRLSENGLKLGMLLQCDKEREEEPPSGVSAMTNFTKLLAGDRQRPLNEIVAIAETGAGAGAGKPEVNDKDMEPDEKLNMSLASLSLSVGVRYCLNRMGISTVRDLVGCTEEELLKIRNFGERPLEEVRLLLGEFGLRLKMLSPNDVEFQEPLKKSVAIREVTYEKCPTRCLNCGKRLSFWGEWLDDYKCVHCQNTARSSYQLDPSPWQEKVIREGEDSSP